jgi:hypothetical protein
MERKERISVCSVCGSWVGGATGIKKSKDRDKWIEYYLCPKKHKTYAVGYRLDLAGHIIHYPFQSADLDSAEEQYKAARVCDWNPEDGTFNGR